jgi:hypothetical protein
VLSSLLAGCTAVSSFVSPNWSENYALSIYGTKASDARMIDGNVATIASTPRDADPREFVVELPAPRRIRRIRVVNENLYRFSVAYWNAERAEWRTLKTVWQRRDAQGIERVIQPVYAITGLNVVTDKIRIVATRTVDDVIVSKVAPDPGDKILDHVRRAAGGTWVEYYRIIAESTARVREVEIYGVASEN